MRASHDNVDVRNSNKIVGVRGNMSSIKKDCHLLSIVKSNGLW